MAETEHSGRERCEPQDRHQDRNLRDDAEDARAPAVLGEKDWALGTGRAVSGVCSIVVMGCAP